MKSQHQSKNGRLLLRVRANLSLPFSDTPLSNAISEYCLAKRSRNPTDLAEEVVKVLIARGIGIHERDARGFTPLMVAVL